MADSLGQDAARRKESDQLGASSYAADHPISSATEDRFARSPFAARIAETLATRTDQSGVVVGLYGPWGDGKTSTLRMMEEKLSEYERVVTVRFNPWYFNGQEALLRGFFESLADAIGKKLSNRREELGKILKKYGGILSLASLSLAGGAVSVSPGEAAKGVGEALSTVELDELRSRLEKILSEALVRVVVMIDDIDRLDRDEIHAVFKLVKLSAGFERTSYVLAFDDEIVSEALGTRYGAGNAAAGRNFLEKIVQVPLHLPPADEIELRALTFQGIDAALHGAGIELTPEEAQEVGLRFVQGLEPRLQTPRQAKLYANAVTFALPLLRGEVNPVDQLIIEGIRIFYPKLYVVIREYPSRFLTQPSERNWGQPRDDGADGKIAEALAGLSDKERKAVLERLIEPLFPRFGTVGYGSEWNATWATQKRICSDEYFGRYFAYGVPRGDIPDADVRELIAQAASMPLKAVQNIITEASAKRGATKLIKKLRDQEDQIDPAVAGKLALALVASGEHLPREDQMFLSDWTYRQAALFARRTVARLEEPARADLARHVIQDSNPLALALECLRWLRKHPKDQESERVLPSEMEGELGRLLAERVREAVADTPIYEKFGSDTGGLIWTWHHFGDPAAVTAHLHEHLASGPREATKYLAAFVGKAWGADSGRSSPADFDRGTYDVVTQYVEGDVIMGHLLARYGSALEDPSYYHSEATPLDEVIAHQFAVVHNAVLSGDNSQEQQSDDAGSPSDEEAGA